MSAAWTPFSAPVSRLEQPVIPREKIAKTIEKNRRVDLVAIDLGFLMYLGSGETTSLIIASYDWLSHRVISTGVLHSGQKPEAPPVARSLKIRAISLWKPGVRSGSGSALKSMTARHSTEDQSRESAISEGTSATVDPCGSQSYTTDSITNVFRSR